MRYNSFVPRTLIIFLQVFGTIFAVIGLVTYIAYLGQISDSISGDEATGKMTAALILSVLFYFTWKTIYTCVVVIKYMQTATDLEISNNRFIISALSLNLGGFLTPFILTSLPNVNVQSTINPRFYLSRVMGITSLVGASIALITFFSSVLTGVGGLTNQQIFDSQTNVGIMGILTLTFYLLILVFGAVTTGLFYGSKKVENSLETKNDTYGGALKVVGAIWMGILTVELVLTIVFAFVRLIGVLADFFRSIQQKNSFMGIFYILLSLANVFLTLLYTFWVVRMIIGTISGLWDNQGIHYKEYEELSKQRKEASNKQ